MAPVAGPSSLCTKELRTWSVSASSNYFCICGWPDSYPAKGWSWYSMWNGGIISHDSHDKSQLS